MKTNLKKIISLVITAGILLSCLALVGCNGGNGEKVKIGIGLYQDQGPAVTATREFLKGISEELNCEFVYVTLSQTDEAANKTAAQQLISSGCKGLILTMDSATEAILEECQKAGIYLGGYLTDYELSFDKVKDNPNFVGTVVDGRYTGTAWGEEIAERIINEGYKNIGMIKFPSFAFPHQNEMDTAFRAKIDEYNQTAADADKITVQAETTELMFQPLSADYFSANPDIDAIFGMCAGVDFIYPTLTQNNKTNIKLYTAGFSVDDSVLNNFGTSGNGCFQELVFSNVEAIVYPLVMLLNKIEGTEFSDNPTEAQRVDSSQIRITNNEELDTVKEKSMYYTGKFEDSFLSASDVSALLAKNGGTHEELVKAVQSMAMENLEAK